MTETSPLTARKKTALEKHLGQSRQYWRDMILGVNDGIISTFLLVTGVAGGGLSSKDILLTSIAGALAGAVSMCAGEYVATKSQNEVITGELALEKLHVESYLEEELSEVKDLIGLIGITDQELAQDMIHYYRSHPDALWHLMKSLEFGVLDSEQRTPITAVCRLLVAALLTITALMAVGGVKSWATRTHWMSAAIENLVIAGLGGVLAYSAGWLFQSWVRSE